MLELRDVRKSYSGIAAVEGASFVAHPGEVTGYLGPNGSGKSTTMKMITGLIDMTSGEILFDGARIQSDPIAYKQRMGYVPEEPHLYPHLTGLEYLVMVSQLRGLDPIPTAERIGRLSSTVHSSYCRSSDSAIRPKRVPSATLQVLHFRLVAAGVCCPRRTIGFPARSIRTSMSRSCIATRTPAARTMAR